MRYLARIAMGVLLGGALWAQGPSTTRDSSGASPNPWLFSFNLSGYIVPGDQSYASPTFSVDKQRLHLGARYNYEDKETGSLWAGYNFEIGQKVVLQATPMIGGVCAKDTDGSYCLSKAKKNGGHTKRGDDQSLLQINTDDWKKSNVQFLFIDANESADQLCTACTKQVMTSYITYETALPYPMGVRSANLLGNQKALWTAINSKCPANYTAAILSSSNATPVNVNDVSAASGASNTVLSITGLVGALMALAATLA